MSINNVCLKKKNWFQMFTCSSFSQHGDEPDEDRPYVKKPLNAFMLFRKEQRPIVMDETKIRDSASINAIVGKKVSGWTSYLMSVMVIRGRQPGAPLSRCFTQSFAQHGCRNVSRPVLAACLGSFFPPHLVLPRQLEPDVPCSASFAWF